MEVQCNLIFAYHKKISLSLAILSQYQDIYIIAFLGVFCHILLVKKLSYVQKSKIK